MAVCPRLGGGAVGEEVHRVAADAGCRDDSEQATTRLSFVRDSQAAGLTLAEIRSVLALRDSGQAPCMEVGTLIERHLADIECRMSELRAARAALREARAALREPARRAVATDPDRCTDGDIGTVLARPAGSGGTE
ncbi:MerR family DNA-binding protein [Streptomyces sp. NPDC056361]|uniref:MerR family DNA-binding protein n=1 Tax=Streptomyces sp. NPDC056361 TaxID=3345795 RepID=UPI0035DE1EB2